MCLLCTCVRTQMCVPLWYCVHPWYHVCGTMQVPVQFHLVLCISVELCVQVPVCVIPCLHVYLWCCMCRCACICGSMSAGCVHLQYRVCASVVTMSAVALASVVAYEQVHVHVWYRECQVCVYVCGSTMYAGVCVSVAWCVQVCLNAVLCVQVCVYLWLPCLQVHVQLRYRMCRCVSVWEHDCRCMYACSTVRLGVCMLAMCVVPLPVPMRIWSCAPSPTDDSTDFSKPLAEHRLGGETGQAWGHFSPGARPETSGEGHIHLFLLTYGHRLGRSF